MRPYKYGCGRRPILRTITEGVSGTAMPSFAKVLSPGEIEQLADFVFKLSRQKGCGCKNR
jgi:mono/diheme cytochrome c family protein